VLKKRNIKNENGKEMKSAAISIIFSERRDEVLLIKRRDIPVYVLPGGGIESFETDEEAAIRETLEETGLNVKIIRKTGEYTPINRLSSKTHVYECQVIDGAFQNGDETKNIAFFPLDQLPLSFFIVHQYWLQDALKYNHVVKRPISEVTYFNLIKYFFKHPLLVFGALLARIRLKFEK